jgi:hypothetical protein
VNCEIKIGVNVAGFAKTTFEMFAPIAPTL